MVLDLRTTEGEIAQHWHRAGSADVPWADERGMESPGLDSTKKG